MTRECDLFQPLGSLATRCLVRCGIHTEGVVDRREGSVVFELDSRWTLSFHHVLYVPCLRQNVLSVSSLEDQGYTIEFRGHLVQLCLNGAMYVEDSIILGIKEGPLYKVWGRPLQRLTKGLRDNYASLLRW